MKSRRSSILAVLTNHCSRTLTKNYLSWNYKSDIVRILLLTPTNWFRFLFDSTLSTPSSCLTHSYLYLYLPVHPPIAQNTSYSNNRMLVE